MPPLILDTQPNRTGMRRAMTRMTLASVCLAGCAYSKLHLDDSTRGDVDAFMMSRGRRLTIQSADEPVRWEQLVRIAVAPRSWMDLFQEPTPIPWVRKTHRTALCRFLFRWRSDG